MASVAAVSADNPQLITDKDLKPLLVGGAPPARAAEPRRFVLHGTDGAADDPAGAACFRRQSHEGRRLLGISRDTLYRKLRQYQI